MICIIDYGLGNTGSLLNMCKRIGKDSIISADANVLNDATHLILPGVGAFDTGMKNLNERDLPSLLFHSINVNKTPILGICLGAQLMLKNSEEGYENGLGLVDGKVVRFDNSTGIKIPHMGWNSMSKVYDNELYQKMPENPPRFYFVHSYHFNLNNPSEIAAESNYGYDFAASFRKDNIIGVQFHPEKSHQFGMQLLTNFFNIR